MALKMWEEYPEHWKTESAFMSYIRGGIRRYLWSKNPVKLDFEKEQKVQIPNHNERSKKRFPTVAGYRCEHCQGLFRADEVECDHRTGEHSLRTIDDLQRFVEGVVFVRKEDLSMLCKPCHGIKTYSERYGVSLEEAAVAKKAIDYEKKGVAAVKALLSSSGCVPGSNAEARRNQLVEHFRREQCKTFD